MTALALVRPYELDEVAPLVMPMLDEACQRIRNIAPSDYLKACEEGRMQLWCAVGLGVEAICVTEVISYPRRKVLAVDVLTGADRPRWLHHLDTLCEWGRSMDCLAIEALARPGWGRALAGAGFKTTHVLLEKELANG